MKQKILQMVFAAFVCASAHAQVNSGSNGSDGSMDFSSLTYSTNIVINMADHPNGIYQYTYVNIPAGVNFTFVPNANNTPLVWLVQSNVTIGGIVDVSGQGASGNRGGIGGVGGWNGGNGISGGESGQGPGGGSANGGGNIYGSWGGGGSYQYGNQFILPLLGGSGGGAVNQSVAGGGGGGVILIAATGQISLSGSILAKGGNASFYPDPGSDWGGGGSGGAIRLVAQKLVGTGNISTSGGSAANAGGAGRIRFDTYDNEFTGGVGGQFSSGSQFIIIPTSGQLPQLTVTSVGGVPVSASPTGVLSTPDAVLSAQQNNPIPVVVSCANLPLNSQITVSVKPASGAAVSATGLNNTGTLSSSTTTISIVIPRGGGLIYATAATSN